MGDPQSSPPHFYWLGASPWPPPPWVPPSATAIPGAFLQPIGIALVGRKRRTVTGLDVWECWLNPMLPSLFSMRLRRLFARPVSQAMNSGTSTMLLSQLSSAISGKPWDPPCLMFKSPINPHLSSVQGPWWLGCSIILLGLKGPPWGAINSSILIRIPYN